MTAFSFAPLSLLRLAHTFCPVTRANCAIDKIPEKAPKSPLMPHRMQIKPICALSRYLHLHKTPLFLLFFVGKKALPPFVRPLLVLSSVSHPLPSVAVGTVGDNPLCPLRWWVGRRGRVFFAVLLFQKRPVFFTREREGGKRGHLAGF